MSRVRIERLELRLKNVDPGTTESAIRTLDGALAAALSAQRGGSAPVAAAPLRAGPDAAQVREAVAERIARAVHERLGAAPPRRGRS